MTARDKVRFATIIVAILGIVSILTYVVLKQGKPEASTITAETSAHSVAQLPLSDAPSPHPVKPSSHPPADETVMDEGSVLASHAKDLQASADNGDLAAAIQLFEESHECWLYHKILKEAAPAALADNRVLESGSSDADDFDQEDAELGRLQHIIDTATPLCAGSDASQVEMLFETSLLRAAKQGHIPAQSCFLSGPKIPRSASADHARAIVDEYMQYAPVFAGNVLENGGEWPAVRRVAHRLVASPPMHPSQMDEIPLPDPLLAWRAVRLNFYRTRPEQQQLMIRLLDGIADRYDLSELELQIADQWAQSAFDTNFADQPPLEDVENTYSCPLVGQP